MSETRDSNGNILENGDSIIITQDLKPKGFSKKLKRGDVIPNIRLDESNPNAIDCRIGKSIIVILTKFVKKKG